MSLSDLNKLIDAGYVSLFDHVTIEEFQHGIAKISILYIYYSSNPEDEPDPIYDRFQTHLCLSSDPDQAWSKGVIFPQSVHQVVDLLILEEKRIPT